MSSSSDLDHAEPIISKVKANVQGLKEETGLLLILLLLAAASAIAVV